MNELTIQQFELAIRRSHGTEACHVETVRVSEAFWGQPVWEGEVLVFDLHGHATASRCYAGRLTAV